MTPLLTDAFRASVADYRYLLERGYSDSSALKLVGDRHQLSAVQRTMLYRGIAAGNAARARAAKLVDGARDKELFVDGLNVLYTIANYLHGRALFIADDGFLRDAGELHGRDFPEPGGRPAALLVERLAAEGVSAATFFLDAPVSHSGELARSLRELLEREGIPGDALTVRSADYELKRCTSGIISSSDSAVISAAQCPVFDLARAVLAAAYSPELIDLRSL